MSEALADDPPAERQCSRCGEVKPLMRSGICSACMSAARRKDGVAPLSVAAPRKQAGKSHARAPNWDKLFHSLDRISQRIGAPEGTWDLERDEVRDLNDAWVTFIESAERSANGEKIVNAIANVVLAVSLLLMLAPRVAITWGALQQRGKWVEEDDGQGNADAGGVAGRDPGVALAGDGTDARRVDAQRDAPAQVDLPWSGWSAHGINTASGAAGLAGAG